MNNVLSVYLDQNIWVKISKEPGLVQVFRMLSSTGLLEFPYTAIHIEELSRIDSELYKDKIIHQLEIIKSISNSRFLDFRQEINSFTLRDRDPFECYDTINKIPQLREGVYLLEKFWYELILQFRGHFPDLGRILNNKTRSEAIDFLEREIFNTQPLHEIYQKLEEIQKSHKIDSTFSLDEFVEVVLYSAGYKTPASDLKKTSGLLSDHRHFKYARHCQLVISEDQNFRRKLFDQSKNCSYRVTNFNHGLVFMCLHANLVTVTEEVSNRSLDSTVMQKICADFRDGLD